MQNCHSRKSKIITIGQTVSGLFGKKLPKQPGQKNRRRERVIGRVMEAVGHHKWKVLLLDKSSVEKSSNSLRIEEKVSFDFDGEMQPDVALNPIYQDIYPFSKIVGRANILIMPALHSAAISTKLMKSFGGAKLIGPLLIGLDLPIEVAPLRSSTSDILNLASIAAYSADIIDYNKD